MKIIIPSYKRSETKLNTIKMIPKKYHSLSYIAVRAEEVEKYEKVIPEWLKIVTLYKSTCISTTRNEIIEIFSKDKHLCILDDDLTIRYFSSDENKYIKPSDYNLLEMFDFFQCRLEQGFAHVSICDTKTGFRNTGKEVYNQRYYAVVALNLEIINKLKYKYPLIYKEDFDLNLTLLQKGFPSCIASKYAFTQKANAKGGCSVTRTQNKELFSSKMLKKRHGDVVKLVKKKTWNGMAGNYMIDVRISWKKAFAKSKNKFIPFGYENKIK